MKSTVLSLILLCIGIQLYPAEQITHNSVNELISKAHQKLYQKYFMNVSSTTSSNIIDDFLAQPQGIDANNSPHNDTISLISHPSCIDTAWLSIESLMRQNTKPHRIILNLYENEFSEKTLPWPLQQQMTRGLEVNWVPAGTTAQGPFTRSDILHASRRIAYFKYRALHVVVIIPYNVALPRTASGTRLNLSEADLLTFKDPFEQFRLLGGELKYLATEGFPSTFVCNPSIIKFDAKTYMTLRVQGHVYRRTAFDSDTFFAELENNGQTLKENYSLIEDTSLTHEDARLVIHNGNLYVSYVTDLTEPRSSAYKHCIEIAPLIPGQQIKTAIRPAINNNTLESPNQKNWLFFEKDGRFLVITDIDPLEVFDCTDSLEYPTQLCKKQQQMRQWTYDVPRSSTAPIYLEEYDRWLVIFHSHLRTRKDKIKRYFLGALVFDNDFNITGYTDKPIMVATPHLKASPLGSSALLPYGCVRENDDLILSLGMNTSKVAIGRLPISRVMELLTYV